MIVNVAFFNEVMNRLLIGIFVLSITACRNDEGVAVFAMDKVVYVVNEEVILINQSKGTTSYRWYFGDGNISSEVYPVHQFSSPGTFRIRLVVGHSSEMSKQIQVIEQLDTN